MHRRTNLTLDAIAKEVNPVVGGWLAYFTAFYPTAVKPLCKRVDRILVRWAMKKYKRLKRSVKRAREWLPRCGNVPWAVRALATASTTLKTGRHEPDESRGSRPDL